MAATAGRDEGSEAASAHPARVGRGRSATDTARVLHISRATVHLWHRRYHAEGLGGLVDRPRSGRPTVLDRRTVEHILLLCHRSPNNPHGVECAL